MIARLRHLSNSHQVADDLLKRFGLTDAADRRASTYSGGMRRRLDIAMSLIGGFISFERFASLNVLH
jgi:ABC-2 type transport system ATP-binding protein